MGFWMMLLVMAAVSAARYFLRPKIPDDSPGASGVSELKAPTTNEGNAIPVFWGTCKLTGPLDRKSVV